MEERFTAIVFVKPESGWKMKYIKRKMGTVTIFTIKDNLRFGSGFKKYIFFARLVEMLKRH